MNRAAYEILASDIGLGPAAVGSVAERHGRGVRLESEESGGSHLTIWLPSDRKEEAPSS